MKKSIVQLSLSPFLQKPKPVFLVPDPSLNSWYSTELKNNIFYVMQFSVFLKDFFIDTIMEKITTYFFGSNTVMNSTRKNILYPFK